MKTFEIRNGDLVIGPGGHKTVHGADKLRQDLSHAVREPYGSDRFHPRWGTVLPEFVGDVMTEFTKMEVTSEVERVINNYLGVQQTLMNSSVAEGQRPSFSGGEVIREVKSIKVRQTFDRLHVQVNLITFSGENITLVSTMGV